MALPQRIAALPAYIPSIDNAALVDAAPGHRFQMFLRYWQGLNGDAFAAYKKCRPQGRDERATFTRESAETLKEVCPLGKSAKSALDGLRTRQQALISSYGNDGFRIPATSTAPFATGLGNEHPIENGFAFLTPYGLPYLAGSGVKGVLRRAAEELALFPDEYGIAPENAPSMLDIWWLFGFEGAAGAIWEPSTHQGRAFASVLPVLATRDDLHTFIATLVTDKKLRACFLDSGEDRRLAFLNRLIEDRNFRQSLSLRGALDCWDVFPVPAGDNLVVEIMTPHHAGYYMNGQTPHDAESPVPVHFLAVPALSAFDFHVVCASSRLPEPLRATWQPLLQRVFKHAFDWLGFGAKTAVGYGAVARDEKKEDARRREAEAEAERRRDQAVEAARQAAHEEALAKLDPVERSIREFLDQRADKNQSEISAVIGVVKQNRWSGEDKITVARWLQKLMQATKGQWKESSQAKKPEKDREYQNTLQVKSWLAGK